MDKVNERLHIHACGLKDRPVAIEITGINGGPALTVALTTDEAVAVAYQIIALAEGRAPLPESGRARTVPRTDTRQKRSIIWYLPHTL